MNDIQERYIVMKAAYNKAFKAGDWDLVDKLEDQYLDAEFALFDWVAEEILKTGQISKEDLELLRRNAHGEKWDKILDLGLRLAV